MLRLPAPKIGVTAGCNFAIFQVLASVVSGISVTLYKHSGGTGARFKGLLVDYYPWSEEPQPPNDPSLASEQIYSLFRNPLAHDLGLDLKTKSRAQKVIVKRILTGKKTSGRSEKGITELEGVARPPGMSPTIKIQSNRVILTVDAFYWGIRRMLVNLNTDGKRIAEAEKFLESLGSP
jgi:hypothetical protein